MSDLISRKAAIDAVDEAWTRWDVTTIDQLRDKLNELLLVLPSEQPEPCEDCVSRKVIMRHYDSGEYKHVNHISRNGLLDYIEQLPSAQPEIIRCRDCTKCQYDTLFDQHLCNGIEVSEDFYCENAERRTDGTD